MTAPHAPQRSSARWTSTLATFPLTLLFIYAWTAAQRRLGPVPLLYLYVGALAATLIADRWAYRGGGNGPGIRADNLLRYALLFAWVLVLIGPLLEYAWFPGVTPRAATIAGVAITLVGIVVRAAGIRTLGRFFSAHVETWEDHQVVQQGIYRSIRHPAYTGNILQAIGLPLILGAYRSLFLSAIAIGLFLYRLAVEERVLSRKVPGYREYMEKTSRLIPGIW